MKLKHGLWIQIPLTFIFLTTLILYLIWQQDIINDAAGKIKKVPVLIYDYDLNLLEQLKGQLDKNPAVFQTILESADTLKTQLLNNYDISVNNDILRQSRIPHLLTVYFTTNTKTDILNTIQIIRQQNSQLLIDYPKDIYEELFSELKELKMLTLYGLTLLSILILIVFILLRILFEIASAEYWRIYINAGGSPSRKMALFWLHSLTLWIFPLVLAFALVILWSDNRGIHFSLFDSYLTIPVFLAPASSLISLILSGRKI